jgi:glycerol-3-phosphate dehydrogenase
MRRRDLPTADPAALHLAERHGTEMAAIADLVAAHPELAAPMVPGLPYLMAEAVHAVRSEMALGLDDILTRRTRARLRDRRATVAAAPTVASVVAPWAGWDAGRTAREIASFVDSCAREETAGLVTEAEYFGATGATGTTGSPA